MELFNEQELRSKNLPRASVINDKGKGHKHGGKQQTSFMYPIGAPGGKSINRKEEGFKNIMVILQIANNTMFQINKAQRMTYKVDNIANFILVKFKNMIDKEELKFLKRKIRYLSKE